MMNLAFRFPASLSVTIGTCCRRRGGTPNLGPANLYFFFWGGGVSHEKIAFINNFPKIKNSGSHFNYDFSFLGCYLVLVCLLFNNQSVILKIRTTNTFEFSHLWQIRLIFTFERICNTCEEFARICHRCEKFELILHRCDKYVRILHTSKISHLWKTRTY